MMRKIIQWLSVVVMLYCVVRVGQYFNSYKTVEKELEVIQQVASDEQLDSLQKINPNIIGWLSLDGTRLDNPVLQADNNEFYLRHNHVDEDSRGGSIFLDYRNKAMFDRHTIFYGHVLRNGTMFGDLDKFADQVYATDHPVFQYKTREASYELQVFAAYETTTDFYYIETEFTDETFMTFLQDITTRSAIDLPVQVEATDNIVTFSTCTTSINDKERFVVHAKVVEITN